MGSEARCNIPMADMFLNDDGATIPIAARSRIAAGRTFTLPLFLGPRIQQFAPPGALARRTRR